MKSIEIYYAKYSKLTVNEAFDIIYDQGAIDETILFWDNIANGMKKTTLWQLLTSIQDNLYIRDIGPVQFCGGPPGDLCWRTGTLLSYVLDKIMSQDAKYEQRLLNRCGC